MASTNQVLPLLKALLPYINSTEYLWKLSRIESYYYKKIKQWPEQK